MSSPTNVMQALKLQHRPRAVRMAASPPSSPAVDKAARDREEAAYAKGRLEGEKLLQEQLLAQRQEIRDLQQGLFENLRQAVPGVVRDTEAQVVALALEVANRLVSGMPIDAVTVEAAIREALAQLKDTSECHVYLHPEDLKLMEADTGTNASVKKGDQPFGPGLQLLADSSIERGGCVVKTRFGTVDAQRQTKFEQLKRRLLA